NRGLMRTMSAMVCLLRSDRSTRCYADGAAVCWRHLRRSERSKTVDRYEGCVLSIGSTQLHTNHPARRGCRVLADRADGTWPRSTVHQAATTARQCVLADRTWSTA